jgi:hypothetical protein
MILRPHSPTSGPSTVVDAVPRGGDINFKRTNPMIRRARRSLIVAFTPLLLCGADGFVGVGGCRGLSLVASSTTSSASALFANRNYHYDETNYGVPLHEQHDHPQQVHNRRSFLATTLSSTLSLSILLSQPQQAKALPFLNGNNRRQLELCLVTILRTQFWAMNISKSLKAKLLTSVDDKSNALEMTDNQRRLPYLEARLGAKALLTQKIGGGATTTVGKLASFNIKECLDDGKYWCDELAKNGQLSLPSTIVGSDASNSVKSSRKICNNELTAISEELIESLASLVEFDGLETTIDPSPRSSLMLSMYNPQKGTFVYRTLTERVIPSCEKYLQVFGEDKQQLCLEFVRRDYADEIPFEVLASLYDDNDS